MANGNRTLAVVIALVVGLALGWFIRAQTQPPPPPPTPSPTSVPPPPPPPPTCPPAKSHLIEVGPTAKDVSEKDAAISAQEGHKVFWIAKGEPKPLTITFRKSQFPPEAGGEPPFEGGVDGAGNQVIKCNPGGVCKAGRVNSKLKISPCPGVLYYKYWQKLGAVEEDAGLIIER